MSCRLWDEFICSQQKFGQDDLLRAPPGRIILSSEHAAFPHLLSRALKKALEMKHSDMHAVAVLGECGHKLHLLWKGISLLFWFFFSWISEGNVAPSATARICTGKQDVHGAGIR